MKFGYALIAAVAVLGIALWAPCTASAAFYDSSYYGGYTSGSGLDLTLGADGFVFEGASASMHTTTGSALTFWTSTGGSGYLYGLSDNNGHFGFLQTSQNLGFLWSLAKATLSTFNFDLNNIEGSVNGLYNTLLGLSAFAAGLLTDAAVGAGAFSNSAGNRIDVVGISGGDKFCETFTPAHTPIPGAVWLLGTGLAGLVGLRRRFA